MASIADLMQRLSSSEKGLSGSEVNIYTTPSEDLNEVLKKFTIRNLHRIPVVKDEDHSVFLGMLDRREVIQYYNQRIQEIKSNETGRDIKPDEPFIK